MPPENPKVSGEFGTAIVVMMPELDFQRIHDALEMLSRRLGERGVKGEVCLFGGAAFIVEYYYPANQIPPRTRYFIETLFYSESQ